MNYFMNTVIAKRGGRLMLQQLFLLLLLIMGFPQMLSAQKTTKKRVVTGILVDFVTLDPILNGVDSLVILRPDSSFVTEGRVYSEYKLDLKRNIYSDGKYVTEFIAELPDTGSFLLHVMADGYHPFYYPFEAKASKRQFETNLGRMELRRKAKPANTDVLLDEVKITATKLKFYFDGDTLIYDASAFVSDESFTLNDALKKMPGIDVKPDGTIYSSGRKVDALLLNGKDFFNKDRKTLLDNLPAFMVKDVKIYDKTQDSLSLIKREREFQGLVMDVKLKKEYAASKLGNVDVALGTDHHFMGKLFGMKFNSLGRVSVSANINNVNSRELQTSEYTTMYEWSEFGDDGEQTTTKALINYNTDNSKGLYSLDGNVNATYMDGKMTSLTNIQNFYSTGDVFERAASTQRNYKFELQSRHTWNFLSNTFWDFTLIPNIYLTHNHAKDMNLNGSFKADVINSLGDAWQDSLRSDILTGTLQQYGISRTLNLGRNCSDMLQVALILNKDFRIPGSEDALHLSVEGNKYRSTHRGYTQYSIDQIAAGNNGEWQNKYNHYLNTNWSLRERLNYDYRLFPRTTLSAEYSHEDETEESNQDRFALHQLEGWAKGTIHLLGELPDAAALASTLDRTNSNQTTTKKRDDNFMLGYRFQPKHDEKLPEVTVKMTLPMQHRSLHYVGEQADTTLTQSISRPKYDVSLDYNVRGFSFNLSYMDYHIMPRLQSMIDIRNTSTPMFVSIGNPELKGTHYQTVNFYGHTSKGVNYHSFSGYWSNERHAMGSATVFDKQTGVTTTKGVNVEGNMTFFFQLKDDLLFLGQRRQFEMSNHIGVRINRSMSMQTAESFDNLDLYKVRNLQLSDELSVNHEFLEGDLTLRGAGNVQYQRATSAMENFQKISAWNYGYRVEVVALFPHRFELNTTFRVITRKGYNYEQMNSSEYLWNFTVKKHIKQVTLQLDVFDLLNQKKATEYYVSSTGRTESFRNTLRRYAMFHVIWKLSKKQKSQQVNHE